MSGYIHWLLAATIQVALAEVKCPYDQFACDNGEKCISKDGFCDGINHCGDNSDEIYRNNSEIQTGIPCRRDMYVCMLPERYLSRKDEFCTKDTECDENEFACSDGSLCLHMGCFCEEYFVNCNDNSDHIRRNSSEVQTGIPCRHHRFVCMLPERYLSRKADFCTKNPECDENEFPCSDGSGCLDMDHFCPGFSQCNDNSDHIRRNNSEVQTGFPCRRGDYVCMLPERYLSRKEDICIQNPDCDDNEFACSDGSACLDMLEFCDGNQHCNDNSDEIRRNISEIQTGIPCRYNEFVCMLPERLLSIKDDFCTKNAECDDNEFACSDGSRCFSMDQFCDGYVDCNDKGDDIRRNDNEIQTGVPCRRDEYVCMLPERYLWRKDDFCKNNTECDDNEFRCSDGSACLKRYRFCDGYVDCKDGSDEIIRNYSLTDQDGILCRRKSFICMLPYNQASKTGLLCAKNIECDENEFACSDGSRCITMRWFCDQVEHCRDGSDEIKRNYSLPYQDGILCRRFRAICMLPYNQASKKAMLCTKNLECDDDEFRCSDGSACLVMNWFCGGYKHCKDGSDEIKRNYSLPYQEGIPCRRKSDICMLSYNQASKKSLLCTKNSECEDNEFMCADGSKCITLYAFCNGNKDCSDGSDEIKASSSDSGVRCRLRVRVCVLPDQLLVKKEKFCKKDVNCDDNEFRCADGNQCLSASDFCDGRKDCDDGSDEVLFKIDYPVSGTKCRRRNLICVLPLSQRHKQDKLCPKGLKCGAYEFACLDGSVCLPTEQFCDGTTHCSDGSDEMKEGADNPDEVDGSRCRRDRYKCILPESQKTKKTYICEKKFECANNEFGCLDNTQCLPSWWFCDGYADCDDGSDEMSVGSATDGLACRRDRHVCLLPHNQMSKKVNFCRKPV